MAIETKPRESSEVETEVLATGCEAIAEAIRLADVDVMAAYPIRPYDGVMQAAAKLIANGKMDVEYIVADGEHSQFEIVKHACAVGARVFVGSSGVGWFYAFEAIAVTAGLRLPRSAPSTTTRSPSVTSAGCSRGPRRRRKRSTSRSWRGVSARTSACRSPSRSGSTARSSPTRSTS